MNEYNLTRIQELIFKSASHSNHPFHVWSSESFRFKLGTDDLLRVHLKTHAYLHNGVSLSKFILLPRHRHQTTIRRKLDFFFKMECMNSVESCLFCLTESTYRHQANIDDEVVTMEILDTAGQVRHTFSFEDLPLSSAHRFIWQGLLFLPLEDCTCVNKLKYLQICYCITDALIRCLQRHAMGWIKMSLQNS